MPSSDTVLTCETFSTSRLTNAWEAPWRWAASLRGRRGWALVWWSTLRWFPGGALCYCGNRGCADTVLGARVLEQACGCSLEEVFERLGAGDDAAAQTLSRYLDALAELIYDVRMVTGCDVVLGGELSRLLRDEDIARVRSLVR